MLNAISWWNKIVWKKWKYLLLGVTIIYVLIQIGNIRILGFVSDSANTADTKHRQHVAVKKVIHLIIIIYTPVTVVHVYLNVSSTPFRFCQNGKHRNIQSL